MQIKPLLETDHEIFGAMILECGVSVWKKRTGKASELKEYGVKIDKYTPDYIRVRYSDGTCAYFRRKDYDFIMHRGKKARDS